MADEVWAAQRRSLTPAAVPAAGSLPEGVLAINIPDAKMWVGDANDDPVPIGGAASVSYVTSTKPTSPMNGDLWYSTTLGKLFIYYNDGSSSQWVETGPGVA